MKLLTFLLLLMLASCGLWTHSRAEQSTGSEDKDKSVPRYIRELFDNYTRDNSSIETVVSQSTNTIRSLYSITKGK